MRRSKDCQSLELIIRDRDSKIRDSVTPTPPNPPLPAPKKSPVHIISGAFRCFFNFLTYVYLLRFPLIAIAVVALFFFQKRAWGKMLAGAFDQSAVDQTVALGLTNTLFVYSVSVIGHNVLGYSALRGTAHELKEMPRRRIGGTRIWNFLCLVSALPVPLAAWYYSRANIDATKFLIAIIAGTILGCVITTMVHVLRRVVAPAGHKQFDERFPFMLIPKSWLRGLENSKGLPWLTKPFLDFFSSFKYNLTAVTLDPDGSRRAAVVAGTRPRSRYDGRVLPCLSFVGYKHWGTAIVYVLLLLTWLCWLLSGLAFFLDKYHIPTLLTVLLFFAAAPCRDTRIITLSLSAYRVVLLQPLRVNTFWRNDLTRLSVQSLLSRQTAAVFNPPPGRRASSLD